MKKASIAIVLLIVNTSFAQNKNFVVIDKIINWNLVYKDSSDIKLLQNKQLLEFVTDSTGYLKKTNFSDKKLQTIIAEFKIQVKENRYKVNIYNVVIYNDHEMIKAFDLPETLPLEYSFLKNDVTIRKQLVFGYNFTELFNPYFTELFTIKKKEKNDW